MIPELPIEPPEDKVIATCTNCGGEIYSGEQYGIGYGREVCCSDCIEDKWNDLMLFEKFEVLAYEVCEG